MTDGSCPVLRSRAGPEVEPVTTLGRRLPEVSDLIELYAPRDEGELVFLCSLLDAEAIRYFVRNRQFGMLGASSLESVHPAQTILVDEAEAETAAEIVQRYLEAEAQD